MGNVCLARCTNQIVSVHQWFTNTLDSGQQSLFKPSPNAYHIKENVCDKPPGLQVMVPVKRPVWEEDGHNVEGDVFKRTKDDEKLCIKDLTFLCIMKEGFYMDERNSWVAPLPFKPQR